MKTWKDIEELAEKAALEALIEELMTPARIARHLNCSRDSVKTAMRHHGLKTKTFVISEEMRERLFL